MQDGSSSSGSERHLALHCALGDAVFVRSVSGNEQLGRCFEYVLTLYSLDHDLPLEALLGQHVTVEAKFGAEPSIFFDGIGCSFSHAGSSGRHALYQLTMRPWSWLLSTNQECRVFQGQSAVEIAQTIFAEWGFADFEWRLMKSCASREYCVQYAESDLHFVSRLLEDEGIYSYFRHEQGKHTLVLADSKSAHKRNPGYETMRLARIDGEDERSVITHWSTTAQVRPSRVALADFDFTKPTADLGVASADPHHSSWPRAEIFEYPGGYTDVTRGQTRARIRIEEALVGQALAEGSTHGVGLNAGSLFALEDHPRADQNKEYLVLSASYQLDAGSYESGDGSHVNFSASVRVQDSQLAFRPARLTRPPILSGPQTATVVGPEGREIWTDNYGRVKVQFHWDRDGKNNENSSCWVRVAQLWTGGRFGSLHIPRIGQEVVVEFLDGNPDQPLVTGCVYNGKNMPPYDLPAHQTQSGIKTRSSPGGNPSQFNELRFEDKSGAELISIQAQKDLSATIKNDQHTGVGGNQTTNVTGSRSISIQGETSLDGIVGSKLGITGDYLVDVTKSITLKCGSSSILITPERIVLTAGGNAWLALDANVATHGAQVDVSADIQTAISGGAGSLTSDPSGVTVTGPMIKLN